MNKRPAEQWYWRDWLSDESVQSLSLAGRGFWIDLLSYMMAAGEPTMSRTVARFAKMVGSTVEEVQSALAELDETETATVTRNADVTGESAIVTVTCRRLVTLYEDREAEERKGPEKRKKTRLRVAKFRKEKKSNATGNAHVTPSRARSSSSSASSSTAKQTTDKANALSCPEPPKPDGSQANDVFMQFPCRGGHWNLARTKLKEWEETYPQMHVVGELKSARQWLHDNPSKIKTRQGMTRYLGQWLRTANDSGKYQRRSDKLLGGSPAPAPCDEFTARKPTVDERERWKRLIAILKAEIDAEDFDTWIAPMQFVNAENDTLTIQAHNAVARNWLASYYGSIINHAVSQAWGDDEWTAAFVVGKE